MTVRLILSAVLLLMTSVLLSCSSPSVPSWALATAKNENRGATHLVELPKKTVIARPRVDGAEADDRKVSDAKGAVSLWATPS